MAARPPCSTWRGAAWPTPGRAWRPGSAVTESRTLRTPRMGKHSQRIRRMSRQGLDRMQHRAQRKMKGMSWSGWLDLDGSWSGNWSFTLVHKRSDHRNLAAYADTAPFRWHVMAVVRCRLEDAHGKVQEYDEEVSAATGQAVTKEELVDIARDLLAQAQAKVNTRQIVAEFFILTPLV